MKKSELISREVFDYLVELAAFALDEDEKIYLLEQLNNQLSAIRELQAIPLPQDIEATTHGVEYGRQGKPALRKDEWIACDNPAEILAQAPELENNYIVVPEIPTKELE